MDNFDSFYGTVPVQSPGGRSSGYGHGPGRQPDTAQISGMSPGRLQLRFCVPSEARNYMGKSTCSFLQMKNQVLTTTYDSSSSLI